jgi:hypothetical protein
MTDSHEKNNIFELCFFESLFYSKSLRAHCTELKTVKMVKIGCLGQKLYAWCRCATAQRAQCADENMRTLEEPDGFALGLFLDQLILLESLE